MNLTRRVGLVVGAAALTLTGGSFADTTPEANNEDIKAQLDDALARIDQLEAKQGDNWLTEQRADEITELVQDVLADADSRASLLQGMSGGYDDGFVLSSADGNFLLRINGQLQTRWVYNNSDGGLEGSGNRIADGVEELSVTVAGVTFAIDIDDLTDDGMFDFNQEAFNDGFEAFEDFFGFDFLDDVEGSGFFTAGQDAVILALNTAIAAELAMATPNFEVIEGLQAQLDAFLEGAFGGFTTLQRDAIVAGFGIGTITTFAQYEAELRAFSRTLNALAIAATSRNDEHRSGFENTRTKLWFSGHVVSPQWQYMIEADFAHGGGGAFDLLDAYIAYDFENGWSAMVGQFKAPLLREELVDARYQLAVERSLLNSAFTGGRAQGIAGRYETDQMHFAAMYSNGAARTNSTALTEDSEWSFTFRGEYLVSGTWDQFSDFTSPSGSELGVLVGVAIHFEQEEFGTGFTDPLTNPVGRAPNNDELETLLITADVSAESDGWNVYGAILYRNLDSTATGDLDQLGILVQGGYYFTDEWEGFVRYEWADFDIPDIRLPGGIKVYSWDDLSVITLGVNRYFASHNAKWTTDIGIALDRVEFFAADDRAGFRSDTGGDDGQVVFRTQLQLLF